jgi:hypothetical protein
MMIFLCISVPPRLYNAICLIFFVDVFIDLDCDASQTFHKNKEKSSMHPSHISLPLFMQQSQPLYENEGLVDLRSRLVCVLKFNKYRNTFVLFDKKFSILD